jgi:hypothetical protein
MINLADEKEDIESKEDEDAPAKMVIDFICNCFDYFRITVSRSGLGKRNISNLLGMKLLIW